MLWVNSFFEAGVHQKPQARRKISRDDRHIRTRYGLKGLRDRSRCCPVQEKVPGASWFR
jgi:hypothetical protein